MDNAASKGRGRRSDSIRLYANGGPQEWGNTENLDRRQLPSKIKTGVIRDNTRLDTELARGVKKEAEKGKQGDGGYQFETSPGFDARMTLYDEKRRMCEERKTNGQFALTSGS